MKRLILPLVLAVVLAVWSSGCGSNFDDSPTGSTGGNIVVPPVTTAPVTITTNLQAREIPNLVTQYEITARDSGNVVVFGPGTVPKQASVTVNILATATSITIRFLDANNVEVGVYTQAVSLVAGQAFEINDPNFDYTTGFVDITFDFEDISQTGTKLNVISNADDSSELINFGFSFTLLGDTFSQIEVSSNGYLSTVFSGSADDYAPDNPPFGPDVNDSPDPTNMIAAYFTDLEPDYTFVDNADRSAGVFWEVKGPVDGRRLIVQYKDVPHNDSSATGDSGFGFETKLYEGSNIVEFHYQSVNPPDDTSGNVRGFGVNGSSPASTFIGLANEGSSTIVQFSLNLLGAVENNTAIRYTP